MLLGPHRKGSTDLSVVDSNPNQVVKQMVVASGSAYKISPVEQTLPDFPKATLYEFS